MVAAGGAGSRKGRSEGAGSPGGRQPSPAGPPGSGPRGQASAAAIMGWQARGEGSGESEPRVLWDGEASCNGGGRAVAIMGWRGLPRPEGGRWVAGSIMGWRALCRWGSIMG